MRLRKRITLDHSFHLITFEKFTANRQMSIFKLIIAMKNLTFRYFGPEVVLDTGDFWWDPLPLFLKLLVKARHYGSLAFIFTETFAEAIAK